MAAHDGGRRVFEAEEVKVSFKPRPPTGLGNDDAFEEGTCGLVLATSEIILSRGRSAISIPVGRMKSIEIHQPIFGSNYITGEYVGLQGEVVTITLTFHRGGATEFARAFFRIAEGHMVVKDQSSSDEQRPMPSDASADKEDKKNR